MKIVSSNTLCKTYHYYERGSGLRGAVKGLFHKKKLEKTAVNNISFDIEAGEFIGLIGPNGAGKTTLIKMMTGIIQPSSGSIKVLGYEPGKLEDSFKKQYSLVMGQKSQLWWDLPAIDSFNLNKAIYEIPDDYFKKKLEYFIKKFNIESLLNVQVRQLSLGERMKMELISSLLHDPKIIFLDEPTIGLDVIAQKSVREFLKEINKEFGTTIVLTSHYMEDIKNLCSRVIVVNYGKKVYDGDLDVLLNKFKQEKIITVDFQLPVTDKLKFDFSYELIEQEPYKIVMKIPKAHVNTALQKILEQYEVSDINIEEEDISDLIEKIYCSEEIVWKSM